MTIRITPHQPHLIELWDEGVLIATLTVKDAQKIAKAVRLVERMGKGG